MDNEIEVILDNPLKYDGSKEGTTILLKKYNVMGYYDANALSSAIALSFRAFIKDQQISQETTTKEEIKQTDEKVSEEFTEAIIASLKMSGGLVYADFMKSVGDLIMKYNLGFINGVDKITPSRLLLIDVKDWDKVLKAYIQNFLSSDVL